ncbi:MAG: thioredoxin [Hyphomonadaceae bacterium]|nr:thioredoxin [Hyphomonadaceae bacterium]
MSIALTSQAVCTACGSANRIPADKPVAAAKCGRCGTLMGLDAPAEVNDSQLKQVLEKSSGLVLLDVWAPWCGPCTAMAPQFSAAARTLAGHARLVKLNADHSQMVRTLGVSGIPALILFRDGRIIDRKAGLIKADALVAWVRGHLSAPDNSAI